MAGFMGGPPLEPGLLGGINVLPVPIFLV